MAGKAKQGLAAKVRRGRPGVDGKGSSRLGSDRQAWRGSAQSGKFSYVYKDGGAVKNGVAASTVADRLEALRNKIGGQLAPIAVIDDARSTESPLHKFFEWDDTKAAHQHRLWQAQHLIASIKVVYRDQENQEQQVRAFVNLRDDDEQYYTSTVSILSDAGKRERVLRAALDELEQFRERYKAYEEFFDLFATLARVRTKIKPSAELRS